MVVATACALRRVPCSTSKMFTSHARTSAWMSECANVCSFSLTFAALSKLLLISLSGVRCILVFLSGIGLGGIVGTLLGRHTSRMACWLSLVAQQDAVECSYLKVIHISCDGRHAFASAVYLWFFDHVGGAIDVQCPRCVCSQAFVASFSVGSDDVHGMAGRVTGWLLDTNSSTFRVQIPNCIPALPAFRLSPSELCGFWVVG